eukprot:2741564-Alexandrium_andersonii.AAC.1
MRGGLGGAAEVGVPKPQMELLARRVPLEVLAEAESLASMGVLFDMLSGMMPMSVTHVGTARLRVGWRGLVRCSARCS